MRICLQVYTNLLAWKSSRSRDCDGLAARFGTIVRGWSDEYGRKAVAVSVMCVHTYPAKSSIRIPDRFQRFLHRMTFSHSLAGLWLAAIHHL
jgi:hypothetical protein